MKKKNKKQRTAPKQLERRRAYRSGQHNRCNISMPELTESQISELSEDIKNNPDELTDKQIQILTHDVVEDLDFEAIKLLAFLRINVFLQIEEVSHKTGISFSKKKKSTYELIDNGLAYFTEMGELVPIM